MNDTLISNGVAVMGGSAAAFLYAAYLVQRFVRRYNRDIAENMKDRAEGDLYRQLAEQVKEYRQIADTAFKERNDLLVRVVKLEGLVAGHGEVAALVSKLKTRLDEKDETIQKLLAQSSEERRKFLDILTAKDSEIAKRDERIVSLETRQRELEIRLAKDEVALGFHSCPLHPKVLGDFPSAVPETGELP